MKSVILAAAAIATFAAAGSASAQSWNGGGYDRGDRGGGYDRGGDYDRGQGRDEGRRLEMRVDMAARNGTLSWREAQAIKARIDGVQRLQWRYGRDGLTRWEASDIARRYDSIRASIRWERNDRDDRPGQGYGGGYGGGYGQGGGRWR